MSEATGNIGRTRIGGQILLMDGLPTFPLIGNLEFTAEGDSFPSIPFLIFTPKQACLNGNSGGYFIFCVPFWDRRCHHISALQSLSFFLVPVQTGTLPPPQPRNSNPSPRAADSCLPAPLTSLHRCLKLKISNTRLWLPPPHQWFLPVLSLFHHINGITVPSLPKWRITLHSSLCHLPRWWTPKVHLKSIPKSPPPGATPV